MTMLQAMAQYAQTEMLPPAHARVERHRHAYENRYCNPCQCTTRHEVKETSYACLRCGTVKHPTRLVAPKAGVGVG